MTKRTKSILERLDERYTTEFRCSLNYTTPWELLAATMLSAQCTDERVNIVTKDLFVKYPDVSAVAHADVKEMEQDIRSIGFYHSAHRVGMYVAPTHPMPAISSVRIPTGIRATPVHLS